MARSLSMKGHLRRCRSALRAHVRPSTLRAQGPPLLRHPEGRCCLHFSPSARCGFALRPTAKKSNGGSPRRGHLAFPEQAPDGVTRTSG
jgi:hypothetical protein